MAKSENWSKLKPLQLSIHLVKSDHYSQLGLQHISMSMNLSIELNYNCFLFLCLSIARVGRIGILNPTQTFTKCSILLDLWCLSRK